MEASPPTLRLPGKPDRNRPGWSRNSVMEPLPMNLENSFSWNVVTRNFHAHEQLRRKLRSKLTKLERHLQRSRTMRCICRSHWKGIPKRTCLALPSHCGSRQHS